MDNAIISDCGLYRYRLERDGPGEGRTAVIMVNPSTADAVEDDQTIRKLKGFGEINQWGGIIVGNLFAFRSKNVDDLATAQDPRGPDNMTHLRAMMAEADRVIFAWGSNSKLPNRLRVQWRQVDVLARELGHIPHCLGKPTKDGHPVHPQMLGYANAPQPWNPAL